jgi:hypothetical protein
MTDQKKWTLCGITHGGRRVWIQNGIRAETPERALEIGRAVLVRSGRLCGYRSLYVVLDI